MRNSKVVALLHLVNQLSVSLWCGGIVFFSFFAAPRVFAYLRDQLPAQSPPGLIGLTRELGRRIAGGTVGAVFPAYFAAQIVLGGLALASGLLLVRLAQPGLKYRNILIGAALFIVSAHAVTVYPKSTSLRAAHYRAVDSGSLAEAAEYDRQFATWHGVSQVLNLLVAALTTGALIMAGLVRRPA